MVVAGTLQEFCTISRRRPCALAHNGAPCSSCLLPINDYFLCNGEKLSFVFCKGGNPMALNICWLDDLAKAKDHARQTKKPVLLDFFNPQ